MRAVLQGPRYRPDETRLGQLGHCSMNAQGRPPDPRRCEYARKFRFNGKQTRNLSDSAMDQLDHCADDEARRIMLGISEQFTSEELAEMNQ